MILNTRVLLTTDGEMKDSFIKRFDFKKQEIKGFDVFMGERIIEDEKENIVFVYFDKLNLHEVLDYLKDNFIVIKYVVLGFSKIARNNDLKTGDIMIPHTILDNTGNNPIFIDYAVGENYDLNQFGLILNGVCMEKTCGCGSVCDNESDEYSPDITDINTYKIISNLNKEEQEKTVAIRLCIENKEDKNKKEIVDNLLNIVDVMI